MSELRVGVDIGGTFTDVVLINEKGDRFVGKTLTTYKDFSIGVMKGIDIALQKSNLSLSDINEIIHGTTLVANALIERKGDKTALLNTEGFRDVIEIGTENRYDLDDLFLEKPKPLVPRYLRLPISERMDAKGNIVSPINFESLENAYKVIKENDVQAVAICFLHSYQNPVHEKLAAEWLKKQDGNLIISTSSDVVPEIREYPRTVTTIANVYVRRIVERYLYSLKDSLHHRGFEGRFSIMLSGGGRCTIETAALYPIRILESGPVGGALSALYSGRSKENSILAFDMGGTTAKLCVIIDNQPNMTNEFEVDRIYRFKKGSGFPIKVPVIEMVEIGAGGGSIANIDRFGLLKVGPQSAASEPGPVCYGQGGTEPTVTDANLVLNYLNPDFFLGGKLELDTESAKKSIKALAENLNITYLEAAWGIHSIVNENMAAAARIHLVEKGKDPRDFTLFCSGGAGPIHACEVAEILKINKVICPPGAGTASAFGFLTAPMSFEVVKSYYTGLNSLNTQSIENIIDELEQKVKDQLTYAHIQLDDIVYEYSCDMRYQGQFHEIKVPISKEDTKTLYGMSNAFETEYERMYTQKHDELNIEIINWRVVGKGPSPQLPYPFIHSNRNEANPIQGRAIYYGPHKGFVNVPIYRRDALGKEFFIRGPAIIEEDESTFIVGENFKCFIDDIGNIIAERIEIP